MRFTAVCLTDDSNPTGADWHSRIVGLAADYDDLQLVLVPPLPDHEVAVDIRTGLLDTAKDLGIYIAGAIGAASFLIGPDGKNLIARATDLYPVVHSNIGDLAVVVGNDIRAHEVVRGHTLAGAEIILNPARERPDALSHARNVARPARAYENLAVVMVASAGGSSGAWDSHGALISSGGAETDAIAMKVDLESLRTHRARPVLNFPAQLRTKLYAAEYNRAIARLKDWNAPPSQTIEPYQILLAQSHITTVPNVAQADEVITTNLDRSISMASKFAGRPDLKLVVFPEYWMTGASFGKSVDDFWPKVGIRVDGPHFERLQQFASKTGSYVSGAIFEYDPEWPRRWFNTAFIINPSGDVILKYRKIQCGDINGLLNNTTPGNVYSEYVKRYGEDGLFPVVKTDIGNLAACICYDTNFPELWRSLTLRGAELIVYPTGEPHNAHRTPWDIAKCAHAAENQIYIASANAGCEAMVPGSPTTFFHRGFSKLIGPDGRTRAVADTGGEVPLVAHIDIEALRRERRDKALSVVDKIDYEKAAEMYRNHEGFPLDWAIEKPTETASEGISVVMETMARYREQGIYRSPYTAA
ncbi:MAG: nitrilase-related carbon-nitrogen hydrolase [Rhodospirillaceae bacterium]